LAQRRRQQVAVTPCRTRDTRFAVAQDTGRGNRPLATNRNPVDVGKNDQLCPQQNDEAASSFMNTPSHQTAINPPGELGEHVFQTYFTLRLGMGIIAGLFPFALVGFGYLVGVEWQRSMSAYYFALPQDLQDLIKRVPGVFPTYPTRVLFSGILFALGTFLYLYKGFSRTENIFLNIAGICAYGVAMCPKSYNYGTEFPDRQLYEMLSYAHGTFALVLFFCMAFVAWFCADDTLPFLPEEHREKKAKFATWYGIIAVAMAAFPLVAFLLTWTLERRTHYIFVAEALGVITFAIYWIVKSIEMCFSEAEKKALKMAPVRHTNK
jgi:hypothetical protein